jgi:DNA-binding IclR family transcriptional regulator
MPADHMRKPSMRQRKPKATPKPYSGTQAIVRASHILKAIGTAAQRGLRVVDLCDRLDIERPTIHRILSCLVAEGLVVRDDNGKRYLLGDQIHRLGMLAASRLNLREICKNTLTKIASATGDTVFLATRRGDNALVIDRRIGPAPVRAMPLDVGMPRPLGVGATGLAILGALPDKDVEAFIENNAHRLREHNVRPERLPLQLSKARRNGYAYSRGYGPPRLSGIGIALRDGDDRCIGAISVTNIAQHMTLEHRREVLTTLRDELATISDRLRMLRSESLLSE